MQVFLIVLRARAQRKREREANGVAISAPLAKQLNALAQRFKIDFAA